MAQVDDTTIIGEDTIPVRGSHTSENGPKCPNCGSKDFVPDDAKGELYCRNCGTVIDEARIDTSREWRAFSAEEKSTKSRAGSPITYTKADKGISTQIGYGGELSKVPGPRRGKYFRMRKWDRRAASSQSRSLQNALSELEMIISDLKLPQGVYEEAARLTEKAREEGIIKGRGIEPTVASLAYLVARKQGIPRTLEEVAEAASISERKLGKTYRFTARELDMDIKPARPEDFIPRYAGELGLSGKTHAKAKNYIKEARDKKVLAGRSPKAIVAAVLYLAAIVEGEQLTQKRVADTVGVTSVTIRKNYREIAEALGIYEEVESAR